MAPKKKNSFYFFMKEVQEREEAKGHRIPIKSMAPYAHPLWQKMSAAEREPYEEMARQFKNDPNLRGGKLASDGTRIEDNLREKEEMEWRENKMKHDVKRYCNTDCTTKEEFHDIAPKKLFYFLSFNILCCTDDEVYIPIEVGLVEYSIQHGIHRHYSKILYPGHPPTGYAGSSKIISEEKHQISIFEPEENSEKDMRIVFEEIKKFTNPTHRDEYPPIFCERSHLSTTVGCLDWLSRAAGKENVFEIWDATYLLMELRAGVGDPLPSQTIASDLLTKSCFNHHSSTRCDFHEEKDSVYCALTYIVPLCYLISDAVCHLFDIQLTEKHIPNRADEEKAYTVTVFKEAPRSFDNNPVQLDRTGNYYQNDRREEISNRVPIRTQPRQPNSISKAAICIADEMKRLKLEATTATVPGHGIGRGQRRQK